MTSWRRSTASRPAAARAREDRGRPLEVRDGDRRSRARPLDRRGDARRAMSRSTPRPTASTASSPSSPGSASRPRPTAPATSRSATAAATCIRTRRTSCRWSWCSTKLKPLLEDPAVLKIGHNLKYDWVMFDKAGIDVAPVDDTMVMSFDLDAGRSFGHGLDELAKSHFDHECIPLQAAVRDGREADHLRQGAARPGDRICRRGRRHHAAAVAAAEAAAGARRTSTRVYERVDQPLVPVIGADGAARDQGRPRLSRAARRRVRRGDRGARGADLRGGVRAVHHRHRRSSSARCCTSGSA